MKRISSCLIILLLASQPMWAQRCHCQHFIKRTGDGSGFINGIKTTVRPGDTICVEAGEYRTLSITNIHGSEGHPVVIINCGGLVSVGAGQFGVSIVDCSFFRFTGTGDTADFFGIKVFNPLPMAYDNAGIGIGGNSSDAEVDHVEITKVETGIIAKGDPNCNPSTWEEGHTIRNLSFHDLFIHRIVDIGLLIGYPGSQATLDCDNEKKTVNPQKIIGLKIYNCRIDSIGGVGIEVSDAPGGVDIFHNLVENYGLRSHVWFQGGIILGGLVNGNCYDNLVMNGSGSGLQIMGMGKIKAYNNILVHTGADGQDAIFVDDRPSPEYKTLEVYLINNTIIGAGRNAIRIQNYNKTISSHNIISNNLILESSNPFYFGAGHVLSHNLVHLDPKWARLDDHYAPQAGSPARNAGGDPAEWGITTDFNGNPRAEGKTCNVGAVQMPPNGAGLQNSLK